MKQFELRFLDISERVVAMRVFTCHDDLGALGEAERQAAGHTIEVWDGIRKVARVKQGNLAPLSTDRLSG